MEIRVLDISVARWDVRNKDELARETGGNDGWCRLVQVVGCWLLVVITVVLVVLDAGALTIVKMPLFSLPQEVQSGDMDGGLRVMVEAGTFLSGLAQTLQQQPC